MKPSVSRDNNKEADGGEFTTERTALNIVAKNGDNLNYDPMVVPNKIAPYNDAKVLTGKEDKKNSD